MKRESPFVNNTQELSRIVHQAVTERNISMNEISKMTGLAGPTIMRIYHGQVEKVQAKTVRTLLGGLGYAYSISPHGELSIEDAPQARPGRLSSSQKERILKAVMKAVRTELDRL